MPNAADQANIIRLYEELGVRPGDGLERLTERYRQRLRELHPDAQFDTGQLPRIDGADGGDGLGWLTRSYREAAAFARLHGRLPGADGGPPSSAGAVPSEPRRPRRERRVEPASREALVPMHTGWRWLIGVATVVTVVLLTVPELLEPDVTPFSPSIDPPPIRAVEPAPRPAPVAQPLLPGEPRPTLPRTRHDGATAEAAAPASLIGVGSSEDDVLRIQGEPTLREAGVWQYGPSFVRFDDDGRVRDWHSSPLQPLRVAGVR